MHNGALAAQTGARPIGAVKIPDTGTCGQVAARFSAIGIDVWAPVRTRVVPLSRPEAN